MIKCWICGNEATETREAVQYGEVRHILPPSLYVRSYCSKCRKQVDEQEKADRDEYIRLKKNEMFLKACNILEKQGTNMYLYKESIDVVHEHIKKHPDKFDSSYEVLTAIVLVYNRIYSKMQYKVGPYQVDFLLPELFVVLEIDGERHKNRKGYDSRRDEYIRNKLGAGWDIIRIATDNLDKNAKALPEAINKVIDYRQTGIFKA